MDDQQIDQLLTAALGRRRDAAPAVAGDDCLDAETLAAWSAGALSAEAADRVEVHLSNCLRCQEMAAVFAAAEPAAAASPTVIPIRRRFSIRWVLPIAAAAAASLVWFVWPVDRALEPASQIAKALPPESRAEPAPPAPVAAPPEERPAALAPATPAPKTEAKLEDKNLKPQTAQPQVGQQARSDAKKDARDRQTDALAPVQPRAAIAPPPPARTEPPPPDPMRAGAGAPPATPPPPATGIPPKATTPPAPPPPPAPIPVAAPAPPPAPAGAARQQAFAETVAAELRLVVAEFMTVEDRNLNVAQDSARVAAGRGGGGGGGRGGGVAGGAAAPMQQAAETESTVLPRWRILASGNVERSTDAGKSWTALPIDPPVQAISGASPSRTTCWLIGRGGVVLLSTDGVRFQRVSSPPTSSELSTIRATNARQATVTTADGRSFVTTDGGTNWRENK